MKPPRYHHRYVFHILGKHEYKMMHLRASSSGPQFYILFLSFILKCVTVQAKLRGLLNMIFNAP